VNPHLSATFPPKNTLLNIFRVLHQTNSGENACINALLPARQMAFAAKCHG
jgi:hypothetical protein